MKSPAILGLLLVFMNAVAQVKAPQTDFVLQAGNVFWQHTYDSELSADELKSILIERITADPRHTAPVSVGNNIRFSVDNDKPNLRKYGIREFKAATIAKLYLKYEASIEIKDNQYTVTLTRIFADNKDRTARKSGDISQFICNTSNLSFKTDDHLMEGLQLVNRHLTERFDITVAPEENPLKTRK